MNDIVTEFWEAYVKAVNAHQPTRSDYCDNKKWTQFALRAAQDAIRGMSIPLVLTSSKPQCYTEYMRVDLLGCDVSAPYDWCARIALEHENGRNWQQELCKLCHVVADLRVILSYHDFSRKGKGSVSVEKKLRTSVNRLEGQQHRITRVPDSRWLFAFGPLRISSKKSSPHSFEVFTLDGAIVRNISNDFLTKLNPYDWPV